MSDSDISENETPCGVYTKKCKKTLCNYIVKRATNILELDAPEEEEEQQSIKIEADAKDQIMYVIYITLKTIASQENIDTEKDVGLQIKNKLDIECSSYMIYSFVYGITNNMKYTSTEDDSMNFIYDIIKEENLIQHSIEIISNFIKILSEKIAKFIWGKVKTINSRDMNTILRLIDSSNTNPRIFKEIYNYAIVNKNRRKKL